MIKTRPMDAKRGKRRDHGRWDRKADCTDAERSFLRRSMTISRALRLARRWLH